MITSIDIDRAIERLKRRVAHIEACLSGKPEYEHAKPRIERARKAISLYEDAECG